MEFKSRIYFQNAFNENTDLKWSTSRKLVTTLIIKSLFYNYEDFTPNYFLFLPLFMRELRPPFLNPRDCPPLPEKLERL